MRELTITLFCNKIVDKVIAQHAWAAEEEHFWPRWRKDKKSVATLDNTIYLCGRFMVPKAILEKIAIVMGWHIRAYSKAGIFVNTDQDLVLVLSDSETSTDW